MDVQEIVSRASALVAAGDGIQAIDILTPLWTSNKAHPKINRMMSAARVAAACGAYGEGHLDQAMLHLDSALKADPHYPPSLAHRAIVALRQGRPATAAADFAAAIHHAGDAGGPHGWIWVQAASLARQANDFGRAENWLNDRLSAQPDDMEARYTRSFVDLAAGRFDTGWRGYEARWRISGFASPPKQTAHPRWTGADTEDRLLVWREQGVGDEIMFARHLPAIEPRVGDIVVECDPRLASLFRRSFPTLTFTPSGADLRPTQVADTAFDCHIPMGSLPGHITDAYATRAAAYLKAAPDRAAEMRRNLRHLVPGKRLIGISWWSKNAEHGATRSPPPSHWRGLLDTPDAAFFSLQYEAALPTAFTDRVRHIDDLDLWQDIDGLAAAVTAMDHIVTIDNSTAHLAGALGAPTELLLPAHADWRWQMAASAGYGLYETVRTHRQAAADGWSEVFKSVAAALRSGD